LFRRTLSFHLEQAGYQVYTSANAEDALALAQRERPNLILLDIGLPGQGRTARIGNCFPAFIHATRKR
jgi:DNA-binding response OmpR family regulator